MLRGATGRVADRYRLLTLGPHDGTRSRARHADHRPGPGPARPARAVGARGPRGLGRRRPRRRGRDRPRPGRHGRADRGLRPAARGERQLRRRLRQAGGGGAARGLRRAGRHPGRREQPGQAHPRRAQGVVPPDGACGRGDRHGVRRDHPGRPARRLAAARRRRRGGHRRRDHRQRGAALQAAAARGRCSPSCPGPRSSTASPPDPVPIRRDVLVVGEASLATRTSRRIGM